MSISNFDAAIDQSWREFTDDLVARLDDLRHGVFEFIELSAASLDHQSSRLVTFRTTSSGRIRCVIADVALGEHDAQCRRRLRRRFTKLGWRYVPRTREYVRDIGRNNRRQTVVQVIGMLQHVWGAPHPAFLTLRDPQGVVTPLQAEVQPRSQWSGWLHGPAKSTTEPSDGPVTEATQPACTASPDDAVLAIPVTGCCHLAALMQSWLSTTTYCGLTPDCDGVIELPPGDDLPICAYVPPSERRIVFTVTLSHHQPDRLLLGAVVAVYSIEYPEVTFVIANDHVYAQQSVACEVFHPANLDAALHSWRKFVNEVGVEIVIALNPGEPDDHAWVEPTAS